MDDKRNKINDNSGNCEPNDKHEIYEPQKISIIVPIYNAETTLKRCVDALVNQTYQNIEIILVNDGSQDDSSSICHRYADTDERIIVIDKNNGGVSSARNAGLDAATGEYVMFCDSDDWVSEKWSEIMVNHFQPDTLVMCDFIEANGENWYEARKGNVDDSDIYLLHVPKTNFLQYRDRGIGLLMTKIFSRSIIEDYAIRLPEELSLGEDLIFVLNYLCCLNGDIGILQEPLYHYNVSALGTLSKTTPKQTQCEYFSEALTNAMCSLNATSEKDWMYRNSIILSDYEKIFIKVLKESDSSFWSKYEKIKTVMESDAYKKCCKEGKVSTNRVYQWILRNRKAFLFTVMMERKTNENN